MKYLITVAALALAVPAYAQQQQPQCGSAEVAISELAKKYGEKPYALAKVDGEDSTMLITKNDNTGDYTILMLIDDMACFAISGTDFRVLGNV